MIDLIGEFLIQLLLEMPGAFVIWLFYLGKKPFLKVCEEYHFPSILISLLIYFVLVLVFFN